MNDGARLLLDTLERRESRLLCWGVSDVEHSEDELYEACDEAGLEPAAAADARNDLEDLGLLLRFRLNEREFWRTRTAETVRLGERLRQLFDVNQWDTAPTLVAGYRFHVERRRAPRRVLPSAQVIQELGEVCPAGSVAAALVEAMLGERKLSRFQLDATRAVLSAAADRQDRGVVITAGTGAGKTLCFYLPALAIVSDHLGAGHRHCADLLALYPRQELLKDQMIAAVRELEALEPLWQRLGRRPRIAALYGDTPTKLRRLLGGRIWRSQGEHFVCPYIRSPDGFPMGISREDIEADREVLVELRDIERPFRLGPDAVVLSRERMCAEPPELLLCSTEMVNRCLSDSRMRMLLVGNSASAPRLMLLDEVHLYEGITGAQTAMTLRRWRHAVRRDAAVTYVGLSATLLEAEHFLAELTGLGERHRVDLIEAREDDLEEVSSKYTLLLRGDPYSRAQLLSTTIQMVMLLARMLDPPGGRSEGVHPRKTFVFTDDLDVTQRLISNLRDAEQGGLARLGRPLAWLRSSQALPGSKARYLLEGQYWRACESLGHDLRTPLHVDEVSSRDRGVDERADVIVATASLEVGFDDDEVGAVVQHKAPRSMASYIQRVGRAGRRLITRPWSVVVLSDYGRDRFAYQAYEDLFEPRLSAPSLPIGNRYLLGMQAGFATIDWLGLELDRMGLPSGHVWTDLSSPADFWPTGARRHGWARDQTQARQLALGRVIDDVLADNVGRRNRLVLHIAGALKVKEATALKLCWDQPRPVITEMLPTARRRLLAQWRQAQVSGGTSEIEQYGRNPLPEFVPGNLFTSLNLPEVTLELPGSQDPATMPIAQAMRAFSPGRVNKRFTTGFDDALWCWPTGDDELRRLASGERDLPGLIEDLCPVYDPLGLYEIRGRSGASDPVLVVRPRRLVLRRTPNRPGNAAANQILVRDSTNSQLRWHSQIDAAELAEPFKIPNPRAGWALLDQVSFQTHAQACPAEARRFAVGCEISAVLGVGGTTVRRQATMGFFCGPNREAGAMGFTMQADAARFRFTYPVDLVEACSTPKLLQSLRLAHLSDLWQQDAELPPELDAFMRPRVLEISLDAVLARALGSGESLAEAAGSILGTSQRFQDGCDHVLSVIAGLQPGAGTTDTRGALYDDPRVRLRLGELLPVLWKAPGPDYAEWLRLRYRSTLAHAVFEAARALCRDFDDSDLVLDLDAGVPIFSASHANGQRDSAEFWLVEATPGGAGVIESLADSFAADPWRFVRLVEGALMPGDWEVVDVEMRRLIDSIEENDELSARIDDFREARGIEEKRAATLHLQQAIAVAGGRLTDTLRSTIFSRWLRPGSTADTDLLLAELSRRWTAWESQIAIELDARIVSYLAARDPEMDVHFDALPGARSDEAWRQGQALSMLWPRGRLVRGESLRVYSPFALHPEPDRSVVLACAPLRESVALGTPGWRERMLQRLSQEGSVGLSASPESREALADACVQLICDQVELGALQVHPRLAAVTEAGGVMTAEFQLAELMS